MNSQYLLAFMTLLGFLVFLIQRSEPGKRRIVIVVAIIPGELIRRWANYRDMRDELITGLLLALLLNFLFWVFIGRYNPVTSSDKIKVLRLDDD